MTENMRMISEYRINLDTLKEDIRDGRCSCIRIYKDNYLDSFIPSDTCKLHNIAAGDAP